MTIPRDLYTAKTLYTLGGASFGVVAASGAISYAFDFRPRWVGLAFALLIAFAGLSRIRVGRTASRWSFPLLVVAFFNGLLIYCQAVGMVTINQEARAPARTEKAGQRSVHEFTGSAQDARLTFSPTGEVRMYVDTGVLVYDGTTGAFWGRASPTVK